MAFPNGATVMSVFFKPMLDTFGWDRSTLSSVQSISFIFATLTGPFLGRLIDKLKPRKMLFVCLAAEVSGTLINAAAMNIWHLYIGRTLSGITTISAGRVLISNWFVKKRGRALHIAATATPIGTMLLVPLSQQLILVWGWRLTLLFWAGVLFAILFPFALAVRNSPSEKGLSSDGEPSHKHDAAATKKAKPVYQMVHVGVTLSKALRTSSFWFLFTNQFLCGIGCGFMATHIIIFATDIGYSPSIAASLVSVQSGIALFGILASGYLSEKISGKRTLAITHLLRSASFFVIIVAVLVKEHSLWLLYFAMVLFGQGATAGAPLSAGLAVESFGILSMGAILGVTFSAHSLGSALGAYGGGKIYQLTTSYLAFFATQGVLEFFAAACAFFIRSVVNKPLPAVTRN
jgi:MFS family permease